MNKAFGWKVLTKADKGTAMQLCSSSDQKAVCQFMYQDYIPHDNLSMANVNIRKCVLQILHIDGDHWVVALNIRSSTTGVYSVVSTETEILLKKVFEIIYTHAHDISLYNNGVIVVHIAMYTDYTGYITY